MTNDPALRWIENNIGSPEIIFQSTNFEPDCAQIIGKSSYSKLFLFINDRLFQYHYASILYDLWDANQFAQNFTVNNESKENWRSDCYVQKSPYYNLIDPSYANYYSEFTQSWAIAKEAELDQVSVPLSSVFKFAVKSSLLAASPYFYNSDIFTRLSDSGARSILGLSEAQIANIMNLHGYAYFNTETQRFRTRTNR
jgi:hypothetical protein